MNLHHLIRASLIGNALFTAYLLWLCISSADELKASTMVMFTIWFLLSIAGLFAELVRGVEK